MALKLVKKGTTDEFSFGDNADPITFQNVGIDNSGDPPTIESSVLNVELLATASVYRPAFNILSEETGIDYKLSLDNSNWFDALTYGTGGDAAGEINEIDASGGDVRKDIYIKVVVSNDGSVSYGNKTAAGVNLIPNEQTSVSVPIITGVPTIAGTEQVGETLTATAAPSTGNPAPAITWQWERSGTPISGATSETYLMVEDDAGETLTVVQTATNTEGSDTAESAATGVIGDSLAAPVITGLPTISGTEQVGEVLTATPATVSGNPTPTRAWAWFRSGDQILGENSSTYQLVQDDAGETLTVMQFEANSVGNDYVISEATGVIAEALSAPIITGVPTISGNERVGKALKDYLQSKNAIPEDSGLPIIQGVPTIDGALFIEGHILAIPAPEVSETDAIRSWQWLRDGSPINGATEIYYMLTADDMDTEISLKQIETNDVGETVATSSALTIPELPEAIYVSSSGLDTNDGLTELTPVKTLAEAVIKKTNTGRRAISLKGGDEWREQIDTTDIEDLLIKAHGDLSNTGLPIVRSDDIVTTPEWSDSIDRGDSNTNVYTMTKTLENVPNITIDKALVQFWENGVRLVRLATSIEDCQATPGSFYTAQQNPASGNLTQAEVTYHIHPFNSTDPRIDGKLYEVPARMMAVRVGPKSMVRLIEGKRGSYNNGSFDGGPNTTMARVIGSGGIRHQMLIAGGAFYKCHATVENYDEGAGHIAIEAFDTSGEGLAWVVKESTVRAELDNGVPITITAFGGHVSPEQSPYEWWLFDKCSNNIGTVACGSALDWKVIAHDLGPGCQINAYNLGPINIIDPRVRGALEDSSTGNPAYVSTTQGMTFPVNIEGLRFYKGSNLAGFGYIGNSGSSKDYGVIFNIKRSLLLETNDLTADYFILDNRGTEFNFKDCMIVIAKSGYSHSRLYMQGDTIYSGENNLLAAGGENPNYKIYAILNGLNTGGSGALWISTEQANGGEIGSQYVDGIANPSDFPLFTDPDNGDFTITNPNVIFNGRGLERPNVEYTPIPANALEELTHVLSGSEYDN
jgi:hypothetical protein